MSLEDGLKRAGCSEEGIDVHRRIVELDPLSIPDELRGAFKVAMVAVEREFPNLNSLELAYAAYFYAMKCLDCCAHHNKYAELGAVAAKDQAGVIVPDETRMLWISELTTDAERSRFYQ